jgi:hypothetical protein
VETVEKKCGLPIALGAMARMVATNRIMRIEAPPAAASASAALFLGIARLLSATVPLSSASLPAQSVLPSWTRRVPRIAVRQVFILARIP